jgi:hypothetical protein
VSEVRFLLRPARCARRPPPGAAGTIFTAPRGDGSPRRSMQRRGGPDVPGRHHHPRSTEAEVVIAERVGHESTSLIQTVSPPHAGLRRSHPAGHRRRRAAEAAPPDSGVDVRPQLPKKAFYDHGREAYDHGGRAGYSPPLDREEVVMHLGVVHEIRDPAGWDRVMSGPQPSARLRAPRERHARRRQPGDVYLGSA